MLAAKFGLGHHIWTIKADVDMQKCGFTSQVLYPPALCAVKLSIVFFFIRCLREVHDRKPFLYWFAAFIFAMEAAFTTALFFQCRPINYYWDKTIEGTCFNQPAFYYADAVLNLGTDVVILSLPWILFRSMCQSCTAGSLIGRGATVLMLTTGYLELNVSRRQRYVVITICSLSVL